MSYLLWRLHNDGICSKWWLMLSVTSEMLWADSEGSIRAISGVTSAPWLHLIPNIENDFISDSYFMPKLILELSSFETVGSTKLGLCSPTLPLLYSALFHEPPLKRIAVALISNIYIMEIIKCYGWSCDFDTHSQYDGIFKILKI